MSSRGGRAVPLLLFALAPVVGGGSLLAFGLHLWGRSLAVVRLDLPEASRLAVDAALSLAFFLQHSLMVRRPVRAWLFGRVRPELHAALYAIASGAVLAAVVALWQHSDATLVEIGGVGRWLLRGLFLLGLLGFVWARRALGSLDALGLDEIRAHLAGRRRRRPPLAARGPYRWVRHPLYLCALLLVWSCPDLSADRLLFNLLWSGWIVVGAALEERGLVAEFGEAYREYQRRVPMLLPVRRPPRL